jgi:hypothetical protein
MSPGKISHHNRQGMLHGSGILSEFQIEAQVSRIPIPLDIDVGRTMLSCLRIQRADTTTFYIVI